MIKLPSSDGCCPGPRTEIEESRSKVWCGREWWYVSTAAFPLKLKNGTACLLERIPTLYYSTTIKQAERQRVIKGVKNDGTKNAIKMATSGSEVIGVRV
jgi:hypothetical protein